MCESGREGERGRRGICAPGVFPKESEGLIMSSVLPPAPPAPTAGFHPLPADLPIVEVNYVLRYLRGQPFDIAPAAHAAWSLVGYAQKQLLAAPALPEAPAVLASRFEGETTALEGESPLEDTLSFLAGEGPPNALMAIDWKSLAVAILREVLAKVLEKLGA